MPELPEIVNLAGQIDKTLRGKRIEKLEILQPKCLNLPPDQFEALVKGKEIRGAYSRGKWIFIKLHPETLLLLNLGMGGEVLYFPEKKNLPRKYRVKVDFHDGSLLTINFFWFGFFHAVKEKDLSGHPLTASLGVNPLKEEFNLKNFKELLKGKKGGIKSFLMDQKSIAGIGNVYIHDILFKAGLHPNRKIPALNEKEIEVLFKAIKENLIEAAEAGGLAYEVDLFNSPGRFRDFLVGYREGKPCPKCGTTILKIKTGGTSSYICPACQR